MIKRLLTLIALIATVQMAIAQLNVTYISDLGYNEELNDIWGYAAPDGTEYALVGAANGTSIVSLADPENPVQVAYVPGANSIWRDIKTWGTFAYVTTDQGNDGLTVIDMTDLPNSVTSFQMTDFGNLGTLERCHNIWIDEFGYAYLAGCNLNNGGMIYVDCATDPALPTVAGAGPSTYSHDVYTRDNKMYSSEINAGVFSIYDVTDKTNTQYLGDKETDFSFTHNAWLNDAGDVLFTTDELANAPIGSYDVSDPTDIKTLDLFKPLITLNDGVIPHNVHVWNDWIIISYYSDGCIVVDGSNPENLIEVGNFDTYIPANTGFNGAWGAYPYLPSGLILISDIGNGLYVLEPNYVRACWLEGNITDAGTGTGINNASVEIVTTELNEETANAIGDYKTGLATAGTYDVIYSAPGYISQTLSLALDNGLLLIQDVALEKLPTFAIGGQVVDALTGVGIPNAGIEVYNDEFSFSLLAEADGTFILPEVTQGEYLMAAGSWGHLTEAIDLVAIADDNSLVFELDRGYRDEFVVDQGWTISGSAETGEWERGEPFGTSSNNGVVFNPEEDIASDIGNRCYVTGNAAALGVGNDDVDNGNTILTSPSMNLAQYENPTLSFYAWFANGGGNGNPNDELVVRISNGIETVELLNINQNTNGWEGPYIFEVAEEIDLTENMVVEFETSDQLVDDNGHLLEVGIDLFDISGELIMVSNNNINTAYKMSATPNPFRNILSLNYDLPEGFTNGRLVIYDALGQIVNAKPLTNRSGNIIIDDLVFKGLYIAQIEADGFVSAPLKLTKAE
ncbi:MAG: choice-of-anchor B domain-containing protein [Polaribacter sp.]|jgi:choice-of-anchor B domain-containing protein